MNFIFLRGAAVSLCEENRYLYQNFAKGITAKAQALPPPTLAIAVSAIFKARVRPLFVGPKARVRPLFVGSNNIDFYFLISDLVVVVMLPDTPGVVVNVPPS